MWMVRVFVECRLGLVIPHESPSEKRGRPSQVTLPLVTDLYVK